MKEEKHCPSMVKNDFRKCWAIRAAATPEVTPFNMACITGSE